MIKKFLFLFLLFINFFSYTTFKKTIKPINERKTLKKLIEEKQKLIEEKRTKMMHSYPPWCCINIKEIFSLARKLDKLNQKLDKLNQLEGNQKKRKALK